MKKLLFIALLVGVTATACAQSTENPTTFTQQVGNFTLTTLSEGPGNASPRILIGATDEMLPADGKIPNATNAFLVQTPDNIILIDAGASSEKLLANLDLKGIEPEQIGIILLTHTHGDHIGGLMKDGKAVFPNAEIRLSQQEYDWWAGNNNSKFIFEAYHGRIEPFEAKQLEFSRLIDGISPFGAFGHTPGHVGYLLESGGERLCVWGDIAHAMAVQMPYPTVSVTYDTDPDLARASRMQVLQNCAEFNVPVAGMHIAWPSIGYISLDQQSHTTEVGYRFTPLR